MNCDECGFEGDLICEAHGSRTLIYCPRCFSYHTDFCKHKDSTLVRYEAVQKWRVRAICNDCKEMFGLFVSQSGKSINSVTIINKEKHDCFHEEQREQYEESCKNLINLRRLYNKNRWINEHSNYIKSEQWKQKRELVLKRDNYLCQACLTEKATQVHHTSYKHWRNEPLFELVSVCEMCHEKITTLDRLE